MSQMLNQLANYGALDLIGGPENSLFYEAIENLTTTANKLASARSKPFRHAKACLEPTIDYYNFYNAICYLHSSVPNFSLLANLNEHQCIPSHIASLAGAIQQIIGSHRQVHPDWLKNCPPQATRNIDSYYLGIWNTIRGETTSAGFKSEQKKRKLLISNQYHENTRIVGRLVRKHESLQVFRLAFNIYHQGYPQSHDMTLEEKTATQVYRQLVNHFRQIGLKQILCIQGRIQRTMTGQYYANIFIYARPDVQLTLNIDPSQFRHNHEDGLVRLQTYISEPLYASIKIFSTHNHAFNFEQWKVFFKWVLYPLNHYYYESRYIKPSFTTNIL